MQKPTEEIFVEIIREFMGLQSNQVVVRDQNFKLPNDQRIYIVVGMVDSRPYSAQSYMETRFTEGSDPEPYEVEITQTQLRENIQIDIMSRDRKAILQRNEVYLAVNSIRCKQAQEEYGFKIARIPTNFVNTSAAEGGSNINRFTMTIPCLTWYEKVISLSEDGKYYYDRFKTRVDDEKSIETDTPLFEFEINSENPEPIQNKINILWLGQSNASKMFTDFSGAGNEAFKNYISPYVDEVRSINGAKEGCAIHKLADGGWGYYWDPATNSPGPELLQAFDNVESEGLSPQDIDIAVIVHGERDSSAINAGTITADDSKGAMLSYIQYVRQQCGNIPILITPIGANRTSNQFNAWGNMRRALWQLWNEHDFIHENVGFWDLPYVDNLHLTESGCVDFGIRTARRALAVLGKIAQTGTLGPSVSGATFSASADRVYINIQHDLGTDFTFSERRGNGVKINAADPTAIPTAVTKLSNIQYQINAGAIAPGNTVTFNWPWATLQGHAPSNCLKDNTHYQLPLRPVYDLECQEI